MSKINNIILALLTIGLTIGAGISVNNRHVDEYEYPDERTILGRYNTSISIITGTDGRIITDTSPPIYGTQDFEAYRSERLAFLKDSAGRNPGTTGWATISFSDISTGEFEILKNKYSLKLLDISGAASGTFQNEIGQNATGVAVNVEEMGEKLECFSKIYYVSAKASLADLDRLSGEPDVILVDLNIDSERHGPVYIPK
ncbi:MAG: hypothetical protein FIB08_13455 [Candidatus Methanoperedens sp.]|nr:hypothetical protein [Candidatus Methanoperedens sp.]